MALLTIESTNPQFSYAISKNPATIIESGKPFQRELRLGQLYGWFPNGDAQSFRLWFRDNPTQSSFAGGVSADFEYLDKTRYSSPYLPIMMIQTALASAAKSRGEYDVDGFVCSARTVIRTPALSTLKSLSEHYTKGEASVMIEEICPGYHNVKVTAPTVFEVLNILQALCVMQALRDDDVRVVLDKEGIKKYLRVLNNCDAPYYARYLFASRAITNRSVFNEFGSQIAGPGMIMYFGDTRQQRYDAIQKQLLGGESLIDIGCGELFYARKLASRYSNVFAYDADEDIAQRNQGIITHRKLENVVSCHVEVSAAYIAENQGLFEDADVLATEVLEHIPEEAAGELLEALLSTKANKIVVTVPNSGFNDNYGLGEEFRHPEHFYEPSFEDWCDYTVTVAAEYGWSVDNVPIGDIVNDQSVSTMTVFTRPSKSE